MPDQASKAGELIKTMKLKGLFRRTIFTKSHSDLTSSSQVREQKTFFLFLVLMTLTPKIPKFELISDFIDAHVLTKFH